MRDLTVAKDLTVTGISLLVASVILAKWIFAVTSPHPGWVLVLFVCFLMACAGLSLVIMSFLPQ